MRTVRRTRVADSTATGEEGVDTSSMGTASSQESSNHGTHEGGTKGGARSEEGAAEGATQAPAAKPARGRRRRADSNPSKPSRGERRKAAKAAKEARKKDSSTKKESASEKAESDAGQEPTSVAEHPGQLRSLVMASHPRTAVAITVVVAALVALMGRDAREIGISAVGVLVTQLLLGIMNDLFDRADDAASLARRKPIAAGWLPPGNASFAIAVLLLLALPLALQNTPKAGAFLLATVPVGYLHNRWLHRTALSWVGWAATFALLAFFTTLGGWGADTEGTWPLTSFVVLSAALGICVHFLTTLPDLVSDNRAQVKSLPLRIALRTGATKLLVVSVLATLVVVGLLVYYALTVGIAR